MKMKPLTTYLLFALFDSSTIHNCNDARRTKVDHASEPRLVQQNPTGQDRPSIEQVLHHVQHAENSHDRNRKADVVQNELGMTSGGRDRGSDKGEHTPFVRVRIDSAKNALQRHREAGSEVNRQDAHHLSTAGIYSQAKRTSQQCFTCQHTNSVAAPMKRRLKRTVTNRR